MSRESKYYTGVTLDQDVVSYLGSLQKKLGRDRSYLINALIKEHRRSNVQRAEQRPGRRIPGLPQD